MNYCHMQQPEYHNIEGQKSDTKWYMMYDAICMKFSKTGKTNPRFLSGDRNDSAYLWLGWGSSEWGRNGMLAMSFLYWVLVTLGVFTS